ncbi:MAG: peptidoglycan-binding protein, partial [Xanthomonadales bacterium]|nr:peptidoglycan-binding protein [Xanthomonadales bacterium]
ASVSVLLVLAGGALWWLSGQGNVPAAATVAAPAASSVARVVTPVSEIKQRMATVSDSRSAAWAQLLARWQVRSDETSVAQAALCPASIFRGFDCLSGSGTLDQVKRFDRPLILELESAKQATPQRALLLGVGDTTVRLSYAGTIYDIARRELDQLWPGHFVVAFRLPADVPQTLQLGDAGPGVAWVSEQLATLDGGDAAHVGPAYYDAKLQERVRKLQRGFGIRADGIVGPETLFALVSLGASGPHLARDVP